MIRSGTPSLGQHFLVDLDVALRIVELANLSPDESVLEIGPGRGALTRYIPRAIPRVILVERDPALYTFIKQQSYIQPTWEVILGDILQVGFPEGILPLKIISNLPYQIATQILFEILANKDRVISACLMVQREVADRVVATHGKSFSPMSILLQNDYEIQNCFSISPSAFSPPPKINSTVIKMYRRKRPLLPFSHDIQFHKFLKAAFAHRRKSIANSLAVAGYCDKRQISEVLKSLSLPAETRAELLTPGTLYHAFQLLPGRHVA